MTMSPRISKWLMELQSYEYTLKVENSVRAQLAGILTYRLHEKVIKVPNVRPLPPPPPKVLSNAYTLFFDGAFRRATGKARGGLVLVNPQGEVVMKEQIQRLMVKGDALLIVKQILGIWACKNERLKTKVTSIRKLFSQFEEVQLYHIPRKENEDADLLAQQAVSNQDKAHVVIAAIALKDSRYAGMESLTHVVNYILEGEFHKAFTIGQRRKLIKQASTFLWLEGALYQKGKDLVCKRVPSTSEIPKILKDVQHWCRSCHNCQVNGNKKLLYGPQQAVIANGHFEKWGIDVMGPLPRTANGKLYIHIAIDYMIRFGTPLEIVSDNGPGFRKGLLTEVFQRKNRRSALIAPTTIASQYLLQIWKGAAVVALVWFLHRWKSNVLSRMLANQNLGSSERERFHALEKISSMGLFILGGMGVAETSGIAAHSILTVGGVGGVATAFAARDLLGNMLSGVALQFMKPFSIGDTIKVILPLLYFLDIFWAGPVEGQVLDIGLTSTQLLDLDKFPVAVPNSFFSSQVIVNKSRATWRAFTVKIPVQLSDYEKIPQITQEIKNMLKSHPSVTLQNGVPLCYASRVAGNALEITVSCNLTFKGRIQI
ncbi:hypothetical protein L7F22_005369 [Adiantum nelumboides]|nr:hypothetical protein [Adiantum nelumboides]